MTRRARWAIEILIGICVFGVLWLHGHYRGNYTLDIDRRFIWATVFVLVNWLAVYTVGLPDLPASNRQVVERSAKAVLGAALLFSAAQLLIGSALLPRLVVLGSTGINFLVIALLSSASLKQLGTLQHGVRVVAVVRDPARFRIEVQQRQPSITVVEAFSSLERDGVASALAKACDVIVVDRGLLEEPSISGLLAAASRDGRHVRTVFDFYEEWLQCLPAHELEEASLLFDISEIHRAQYVRAKRVIDLGLSLILLPVLLVSLPFVAVGNLIANRGTLLFVQSRVGREGKHFTMVKFRTMRAGGDTSEWTTHNDPRVTAFGKILRRTHVDELPQVINVLMGDLSFVGPRPEQPAYVEQLIGEIPFFDVRHNVRPGITGWAQIHQNYAASIGDTMTKLQYDLYYLRNQSVLLDLRVLLRTARQVFGFNGR